MGAAAALYYVSHHLKRYLVAVKQQPQIRPSWWPIFGAPSCLTAAAQFYPSMHQLPRHSQPPVATQSTVGMSQTGEGFFSSGPRDTTASDGMGRGLFVVLSSGLDVTRQAATSSGCPLWQTSNSALQPRGPLNAG